MANPILQPATAPAQPKTYSVDDFANIIKTKHPEYKDKDNNTLVSAWLKRYPVYKNRVDTTQSMSSLFGSKTDSSGNPITSIFGSNPGQTKFNTGVPQAVVGSEIGLGEDIAAGASGVLPESVTGVGKVKQSAQDMANDTVTLAKLIRTREAKGMDATNLKKALQGEIQTMKQMPGIDDLYPALRKTNWQVGGDIAGTVLDVLAAGSYGTAARGAESWKLLVQGAKSGAAADILAKIGIQSTEKPAEMAAETVAKKTAAQIAKNVAKRTGIGAAKGSGVGYASDIAQNARSGQQGAKVFMPGIGTVAGGITGGVLGGGGALLDNRQNISQLFGGKTQEEILATPESQVYKLKPEERKFYFDNQKGDITDRANAAEAKVKTDLQKTTTAAQQEAETLNKKIQTASRDETIKIRPKIRTALGQQSKEYRRLVNEELAPYRENKVNTSEVSSFIDQKYAANPEQASAIKSKLGVSDVETTIPSKTKGGLPTIQRGTDTTIGNIYDQATSLRQDMSTSAVKGARVYSADEKLTDDAISTVNDFLKSKGIDLKEARSFWAQYAPIRDQLISEAKPFNVAGTQTKTFANTLTRAAQGTDVNNENFVKATQDLIGQPLSTEQKTLFSKLDANDKKLIAAKLDAENQKITIQMQKSSALKNLSATQFNIERQARMHKVWMNIFKWGGGVLTAGTLDRIIKKYTGLGL